MIRRIERRLEEFLVDMDDYGVIGMVGIVVGGLGGYERNGRIAGGVEC